MNEKSFYLERSQRLFEDSITKRKIMDERIKNGFIPLPEDFYSSEYILFLKECKQKYDIDGYNPWKEVLKKINET